MAGEGYQAFCQDPSSVSRVRRNSDSGIEESRKAEVGADTRPNNASRAKLERSRYPVAKSRAELAKAGESRDVTADLT